MISLCKVHGLREPILRSISAMLGICQLASGDKDPQHRLRTLCKEFKDIFSNELPAAPAKIPEFHLTVKDNEWRVARNRAPPRAQNPTKHFSYVRNRPARIRSTIVQSSIVNTHTKSIIRFRNE